VAFVIAIDFPSRGCVRTEYGLAVLNGVWKHVFFIRNLQQYSNIRPSCEKTRILNCSVGAVAIVAIDSFIH